MNSAAIILSVLFFTSLMLSITMTLAWWECGRPRHARTWAIAFAVAAGQWALNAVMVLLTPASILLMILVSMMVLGSSALCAIGFRQRARLPDRACWFMAAVVAGSLVILFANIAMPHMGIKVATTNFFAAAMFLTGGLAVWPRGRRPYPAEITMLVVLALFVLFELTLGSVALGMGRAGEAHHRDLYRLLLGIGLPSGYLAIGVAAVMLLVADLASQLRLLATSDPLTAVLNRRGFEEASTRAFATARRHCLPLSAAIADLDHFKTINDRFGHATGDLALQRFANLVTGSIRGADLFARLGGEEFGLVLAGTRAEGAAGMLERVRAMVEAMKINGECSITVSFGIAELEDGDTGIEAVLQRADEALYRAKMEGRNRVLAAECKAEAGKARLIETAAH